MTAETVIEIGQYAMRTVIFVAGPMLIAGMLVGLAISVFQAATQINEMTMTFVPKILGVFAVSALVGPWMIGTMVNYTSRLLTALPELAH